MPSYLVWTAFFVVGLGAYTRLSDSGLGCPDWPACYGHWVVQPNIHQPALSAEYTQRALIEMLHRYAAGSLGLGIIVTCLYRLLEQPQTRILSCALLLLLAMQAAFGAFTVTWKLHPYAVVPHLIGGMLITTMLVLLQNSAPSQNPCPKVLKTPLSLLWWGLWFQIFLGGWTSANYAAMSCPSFPTCFGSWSVEHFDLSLLFSYLPIGPSYDRGVLNAEARIVIHMLHRLGALVLSCVLIYLCKQSFTARAQLASNVKHALSRLTALFLLQITLGICNIVFQLPIYTAVAHNLTALLLLMQCTPLLAGLYWTDRIKPDNTRSIHSAKPQVLHSNRA